MDAQQRQHLQAAEHHITFLELEVSREQQLCAKQADRIAAQATEIAGLKTQLTEALRRAT